MELTDVFDDLINEAMDVGISSCLIRFVPALVSGTAVMIW